MELWLAEYRRRIGGGEVPGAAPLFPVLGDDGKPLNKAFTPERLMASVKRWARRLEFPEGFCDRLTGHGFRAGGCSDAVNSGAMTKEEIQSQGRWKGDTYELYVHLAPGIVREALKEVSGVAALTGAERRSAQEADRERKLKEFIEDFIGKVRAA